MKKIEWTKKRIFQAVYWGIFALMFLIAVVVFRQDGIYMEDSFDSQFYKLESATEQQRVFRSDEILLIQKGFFPESESVTIEISEYDAAPIIWTLTRQGEDGMVVSDGKTTYTGSYHVNDFGANFYFDDWEKYMDNFQVYFADGVSGISNRFISQESISSLLRIAYGQTDDFGRYSMEIFIPWILIIVMAYVIGFHADILFEWRKMWSFDFRNADQLEPSEWYFVSSYLGAATLWVMALFLYLLMIGLIG